MIAVDEQVIDVVADELDVPPAQLEPDHRLAPDLGIDSIDRLGLAIQLERRFGIAVADQSMDRASTVGDVIDLVERTFALLPPRRRELAR